jgi:DNA-binding response OmpR family regulator
MNTKILFVDDDHDIGRSVKEGLSRHGYAVTHVDSADKALALVKIQTVDLFLLDIDLPGLSGLKLLELLKGEPETASAPVIMLTALGETAQRVKGLKTGADDYMVKPFSTDELAARIEALLRRVHHQGRPGQVVRSGGVTLNLDALEASLPDGRRVPLTWGEGQILFCLMRRKGFIVTQRALTEHLTTEGGKDTVTSGSLYTYFKNIRAKLGAYADRIETIPKSGYRFRSEE